MDEKRIEAPASNISVNLVTSGLTSPHLRELALDNAERDNFVKACKMSVAAGESVSEIIAAIRGTRWRFILTNSGQAIDVEHKELQLLNAIRDCEQAHQRATQFMTRDDNLGHLEHAIFDLFDGTGYAYIGEGIIVDDEYIAWPHSNS